MVLHENTSKNAHSAREMCRETQAHIVSGPIPLRVTQMRPDALTHALKIRPPILCRQHCGEATDKSGEPMRNVPRQGGGPWDERNVAYLESSGRKPRAVIFDRWEVPRVRGLTVIAANIEFIDQCRADGLYAIMAAHLRDEA